MKTINLNTGEGAKLILFPDSQPHVNIMGVVEGDAITVICSLTSSVKLIQLIETADAIDNLSGIKQVLIIPYLMAARYDRLMQPGDSFDLKVVAKLINSCGFHKVYLFDVHSEVATQLIANSVNIPNRQMVEQYQQPEAVLICPDAGAAKKVMQYTAWNSSLKEIVYCTKSRDLSTGNITLVVQYPEKCTNRNCVIIDDICDGGATFLAIADQIKPKHLSLIVSHGIFSKGFSQLEEHFDEIMVSNSFVSIYQSSKVKVISADLLTLINKNYA